MLRILHTESSCGWGGQEIRILTEISGMRSRGYDVHLACPEESKIYSSSAKEYGIPTHPIPIAKKSIRGLASLMALIRNNEFDIINTHSSSDTWLSALSIRLIRKRIPLIRTRHVSSPIPNNFASRWVYQKASDFIITTGDSLRKSLIRQFGILEDHIQSIPTGVDLTRFKPSGDKRSSQEKLNFDPKKTNLVIVATLRSWKGHAYLIEAVEKIKNNDIHLYIVGDGPQRENLENVVDSRGLGKNITLTGQQDDVSKWLQASDIFVLPSYANEGVPQALIQAMACGLPVITTNIGAITELVHDQEHGIVIQPSNAEAIKNAILKLINTPNLMKQYGQAGFERVTREFSDQRMLDSTERVLKKVAARGR